MTSQVPAPADSRQLRSKQNAAGGLVKAGGPTLRSKTNAQRNAATSQLLQRLGPVALCHENRLLLHLIPCPNCPTTGKPGKLLQKQPCVQVISTTSGSSGEQSDDDGEINESMDPADTKRTRRMLSNRKSARRSRSRKQAQQSELETKAGCIMPRESATVAPHTLSELPNNRETGQAASECFPIGNQLGVQGAESKLSRVNLRQS